MPAAAAEAARERIELEVDGGRCGRPYMTRDGAGRRSCARATPRVLGCEPTERCAHRLDHRRCQHRARRAGPAPRRRDPDQRRGASRPAGAARPRPRRAAASPVRVVPFAELAGRGPPATRLVACSHVSWVSGQIVDCRRWRDRACRSCSTRRRRSARSRSMSTRSAATSTPRSGQKWLCGPEGSGCLYVRPRSARRAAGPVARLRRRWPIRQHALDFEPAEGAKRLDHGFPSGCAAPGRWPRWACSRRRAGIGFTSARPTSPRAGRPARERGLEVAPRGRSTLVSWRAADAARRGRAAGRRGVRRAQHPGVRLVRVVGRRLDLGGGARAAGRAAGGARGPARRPAMRCGSV